MKTGIYGIVVGIILLVATWGAMSALDQPKTKPTHTWNEDLCQHVPIRNPGGLTFEKAEVCYQPHLGWIEKQTSRLLAHEYDSLITPLFRQIRHDARSMGVYDEDHNHYIYRKAKDRYVGRE